MCKPVEPDTASMKSCFRVDYSEWGGWKMCVCVCVCVCVCRPGSRLPWLGGSEKCWWVTNCYCFECRNNDGFFVCLPVYDANPHQALQIRRGSISKALTGICFQDWLRKQILLPTNYWCMSTDIFSIYRKPWICGKKGHSTSWQTNIAVHSPATSLDKV